MKCETCRFWDQFEAPLEPGEEPSELVPDEGYGECKRFPPLLRRPLLDGEDAGESSRQGRPLVYWAQPFTTAVNWCGEWKRK
jgi:hypothetical protein